MSGVDRPVMEQAVKEWCVPVLRHAGFKGSFPNFYRDTAGFVALLNFQFFSSGGSFCVNLAYADQGRSNIYFRPETPTQKLQVSQARERKRLGANQGDRWFSYGKTNYGEFRGEPADPMSIATTINTLLESDAEVWWKSKIK